MTRRGFAADGDLYARQHVDARTSYLAAERCVLFRYSKKHDKKAVDELFSGFSGVLVRDAHAIYLHFDDEGDITGAGCWSHVRRYVYKSFSTDPSSSTSRTTPAL